MRRFRFVLPLGLLGLVTASIVSSLSVSMADAASPAYTVQTLHFAVRTGPTGAQACDIVGDLYTPSAATSNRTSAVGRHFWGVVITFVLVSALQWCRNREFV